MLVASVSGLNVTFVEAWVKRIIADSKSSCHIIALGESLLEELMHQKVGKSQGVGLTVGLNDVQQSATANVMEIAPSLGRSTAAKDSVSNPAYYNFEFATV